MVEFITEGPVRVFNLAGLEIAITKPMLVSTGCMIFLSLLFIFLGSGMKTIPGSRKQIFSETIYGFIHGIVTDNMGEKYLGFIPVIGTFLFYILGQNLVGLVGLKPATSSFSTTLGLGLAAFVIINANAIKEGGLKGYLSSYVKPMPFLLPITLMDRLILPISLALRLFGNVLAATVVMSLLYGALTGLSHFTALVLPIPFHAYFDIFDGAIQAVIFTFLTMIQIKLTADESSETHEA